MKFELKPYRNEAIKQKMIAKRENSIGYSLDTYGFSLTYGFPINDTDSISFGGGYDFSDGTRIGYTYYSDLGGLSKADLVYIYYGYRF